MEKKTKTIDITPKKESKAITKPKANGIDGMIELAIKSKSGVDKLEKLMEMKYKHEEREAEKSFHRAFSAMQARLPVIQKTKDVEGYDKEVLWGYAPIEAIVKKVLPLFDEFGFSYRWTESFENRDGYKRVTCHATHIDGHTESAFVDIPVMQANKMTNSVQQAGSSSTYGKRYSFCNVFGIMVENDDEDGRFKNAEQIFDGDGKVDKYLTELAQNIPPVEKETNRQHKAREICYMMAQVGAVEPDVLEKPIDKMSDLTEPQTNQLWTNVYTHWKSEEKVPLKKLDNREKK